MKNVEIPFEREVLSLSYDFVVSSKLKEFISRGESVEEQILQKMEEGNDISRDKLTSIIIDTLKLFDSYYVDDIKTPISLIRILSEDYTVWDNINDIMFAIQRFCWITTLLAIISPIESIIIKHKDWHEGIYWLINIIYNKDSNYYCSEIKSLCKYIDYCSDEPTMIFDTDKLRRDTVIKNKIKDNLKKGIFSPLRFIST